MRASFPIVFAASLLCAAPALAAPCAARPSWPTEAWPERKAEIAAARAAQIEALESYAFTLVGKDSERKGIRTDALLIVQGGAIVYERYARGYDQTKRHVGWSMSKSVVNALTGAAVLSGSLSLEDSICAHLKGLPEAACGIRVLDLLEFASGIDWKEIYENQSNQQSSVLAMLYGQGHQDMARFVGSHRLRDAPGTSYQYSTGEATLLSSVVGEAMQPRFGAEWPWQLLFEPLGMGSAAFERDAAGHMIGGSFFYATARDLAKLAWLFLNDGCWEGRRLVPEGWVASSTKISEPFRRQPIDRADGWVQGRQWWINRRVPEVGQAELPWPDLPEDTYSANGHWGQYATIIPSLDMVIVRFGDDRQAGAFDFDKLMSLAVAVGRAP